MDLRNKQFTLLDYIRIPFQVSPFLSLLNFLNRLISALIPAALVFITADFINTVIRIFNNEAPRQDIVRSIVLIMIIVAYQNFNATISELIKLRVTQKLDETVRVSIIEKRARLEYRHIENNDTWELIKRVSNEPSERMWNGFDCTLLLGETIVKIFAILIVLAGQIWWAGAAIMVLSVPLFYLSLKAGKNAYEVFMKASVFQRRADYLQKILTNRENIEERSLFGYTKAIQKQWYEKYEKARVIIQRVILKSFIRMKNASFITIIFSAVISAILIPHLINGAISVGMFTGIITALFGQVHSMSWDFADVLNKFSNNKEYLNDITQFSALTELDRANSLRVITDVPFESLEMRNVTFTYPGTERCILKDCSLRIDEGRHYAFVGVNGAGKTTITKLFALLYDNYEGEILINGKELREYDYSEIKGFFSFVFQDFAKYAISIKDNIFMGNSFSVDGMRLKTTLSQMEISEFIEQLPAGVETNLGKIRSDGIDISGGQWQRIAISRALVSDSPILILDEPTAALDPIAESNVYSLFSRICKEKTTIVITHRLGAAKIADEIFVIDNGCVAESGSHEELMKANGLYAKMYESQRDWYND